jgi:NADPH2:quinone reductase
MKAIVVSEFGGPDVMRLVEVPDPTPGPGQVVVRIRAAGVNPVDAYVRTGTYARKPPLPYTPGYDGAGDVEAVGSGVTNCRPGDRVWIAALGAAHGTYAERIVCDATSVFALPKSVSYGGGAALGVPAATAHRALFGRANGQRGESVLVHGATGAVGLAAVQLAKAAGLHVLATGGSDKGLETLRREGADAVFNHHDAGRVDAIKAATNGKGVDVVLEMLANVNLDVDLGLLALRGRVVVIGSRGRVEIDPRQTMGKDAAVLGMTLWNVPADERVRINQALTEAMEAGTLRPAVDRELPLAEAPRAHEAVLAGGHIGKIVLKP